MTKRLALTVGIDAYPRGAALHGCVADARAWAQVLRPRGFEVTELLDGAATKAAMVEHIRRLLDACEFGDRFTLVYSGHGSWVPDASGDEPDRRDECLCPVDTFDGQLLSDDEIFELLGARAYGVRVVLLIDACHSGSANRLAAPFGIMYRKVRFLPPEMFLPADELAKARALELVVRGKPRQAGLLMAGCRDMEYSYEAETADGQVRGMFSLAAIEALKHNPPTYADWYRLVRQVLPSQDFPQSPTLNGSWTQKRWPVLA